MSDRIITPEAVLSYPNLFKPTAVNEGDQEKYSCTLVFEEGTDIKALKSRALDVAKAKWGEKLKNPEIKTLDTQHGKANFLVAGNLRLRLPWRDDPEDVASKGYPEGSVFISARTTRKPGVVAAYPGEDGRPATITDESKVYPGVYVKASLDCYAYDTSGNKGVTFGLGNVQVLRDGEPLAAGYVPAEDEFTATQEAPDLSDLESSDDAEDSEPSGSDDLSDLLG